MAAKCNRLDLQPSSAVKIACEYISVACNRTPQSAKWSPGGAELVYAAGKSLAVTSFADPSAPVVSCSLSLHRDRVNCVHFIQFRDAKGSSDGGHELVSGSVDKTIILWKKEVGSYTAVQTLTGHDGSITALAATYLRAEVKEESTPPPALIASASADSSVKIWARDEHSAVFTLRQTMPFGRGFVFGMDIFLLAQGVPLLACGSDDSKVLLYLWRDAEFTRVQCLPGHEDWVRDVQFCRESGSGDLLLATCSQDSFVRLWRVREKVSGSEQEDAEELTVKANTFGLGCCGNDRTYTVTLEAVLIGHEDWVYSVDWHPPIVKDGAIWQPPCLLTASMDKTMIIWKPDQETGMWLEQTRVGEVGGNTLGLFGGIFSNDGTRIVAHGYHGAFHIWKRPEEDSGFWQPQVAPGGHFGPVLDLSWDPLGKYFVSVSSDQTVRLHSSWIRDDVKRVTWHEVARPQVHGYDMTCVSMVTSMKYVSGADEKVMRVFDAPQNFVANILNISRIALEEGSESIPLGASVPALGLSNKAVCSDTDLKQEESQLSTAKNLFSDHQVPFFTPTKLTAPPVEEVLLQNTLWPEVQKLYGHGYEIFAISASPKGDLVASVSKATKQEHAAIRLWEVGTWKQVGMLEYHTLTVTQLAFSHNGERLLAVSRDRCWSLWERSGSQNGDGIFHLEASTDKGDKSHSRIIWACSWTPDDVCFVTVSRDKKALVWSREVGVEGSKDCGNGWRVAGKALESGQPVTAVDVAPVLLGDKGYLIALGHEDGVVLLYRFSLVTGEWAPLGRVADEFAHCSTVKRLKWQPAAGGFAEEDRNLLASCCVDGTVHLHRVLLS